MYFHNHNFVNWSMSFSDIWAIYTDFSKHFIKNWNLIPITFCRALFSITMWNWAKMQFCKGCHDPVAGFLCSLFSFSLCKCCHRKNHNQLGKWKSNSQSMYPIGRSKHMCLKGWFHPFCHVYENSLFITDLLQEDLKFLVIGLHSVTHQEMSTTS